ILENKYVGITPIVVATSAVRDAGNREEFIRLVREQTGFEVIILNGAEEAQYTFSGAQSVLDGPASDTEVTVLDIGGGSTEIAIGKNGKLTDAHSFDMGCVRFTERFLSADRPSREQITACNEAIDEMLQKYRFKIPSGSRLIGVA